MKGEILLGHIRGCRDKPGGETEHADERLLEGGQGSESTPSEQTLIEHLVRASQSAKVTR